MLLDYPGKAAVPHKSPPQPMKLFYAVYPVYYTLAGKQNRDISDEKTAVIVQHFKLVKIAEEKSNSLREIQREILEQVDPPLNVTTGKFFFKTGEYSEKKCVRPGCDCVGVRDTHYVCSDEDIEKFWKSNGAPALFFATRASAEVQNRHASELLPEIHKHLDSLDNNSNDSIDPMLWSDSEHPPPDWPSEWPWYPIGTSEVFGRDSPDTAMEVLARYEALLCDVNNLSLPFTGSMVLKEKAFYEPGPVQDEVKLLEKWMLGLPKHKPILTHVVGATNLPLFASCISLNFCHCISLFLKHGIDISVGLEAVHVNNPLAIAVGSMAVDMTALLTSYSKGYQNSVTGPPKSRKEMSTLLNNSFPINWHTFGGDTILSVAVCKGDIRTVALLITSGADIFLQNRVQKSADNPLTLNPPTPQYFALINGRSELLPLLLVNESLVSCLDAKNEKEKEEKEKEEEKGKGKGKGKDTSTTTSTNAAFLVGPSGGKRRYSVLGLALELNRQFQSQKKAKAKAKSKSKSKQSSSKSMYDENEADFNKCIEWLLSHGAGSNCTESELKDLKKWSESESMTKDKSEFESETMPAVNVTPFQPAKKCSFRFCNQQTVDVFTQDSLWEPIRLAGGINTYGRGHELNGSLMTCGSCGMRGYCSSECQIADWKYGGHKKQCKELNSWREWLLRTTSES